MEWLDKMVANVASEDDWVSHNWRAARAAYDAIPFGDDDAIVDLMGLLIDEIQTTGDAAVRSALDKLPIGIREAAARCFELGRAITANQAGEKLDWPASNRRRGDLIKKSVDGTISEAEQIELDALQAYADDHIEQVAPRPDIPIRATDCISEAGERDA